MAYDYTCLKYVENCLQYSSESLCTEVGSKTCTQNSAGGFMASSFARIASCMSNTRTFSCRDPSKPTEASTTMTTFCDTTISSNGLDWTSTSASAAGDFVQAATAQEFARQLAVYGNKDGSAVSNLFAGVSSSCSQGYLGFKNCCKSSGGGGVTNRGLASRAMPAMLMGAFSYGGQYAVSVGSNMVWDSMISNGAFLGSGMEAMVAQGATLSPGFGALGFGTSGSAAGGLLFGEATSIQLSQGLYFNPYALAAAVAIQLIMEAISCTQQEKDTANAKTQNLCHYIGSYCSNEVKFLGITLGCLETSQTYCCYNGLLGKAVAEGAHEQLGLSWGSVRNPACNGLSVEQMQALDFSTPTMQAFMLPFQEQIMAGFNNSVAPVLDSGAVTTAVQTNASARSNALCLQSQKLDPSVVCK